MVRLLEDNGCTISILPNSNIDNLQRIFYNNVTTLEGFYNGIGKALDQYNSYDAETKHAYAKRITNIKK